ncbi:alpha/beta hydrolase [Verticillium alfalfae VaMs.102]|uniref:Alpha/beta hydrolase n=1 Tax=Verticillium alfalfae (strain VaMs.102 / ATCC MYA-4576 / FGSC 10136) TaxID=526221 RepID=C9SYE7_VERA1|nr:alpha/beta hydrolase [Verticillium alfalfae VaMs.102]EEY23812.1 alpha/beta hydrolase [Verticillium alfalfae VaMs.102]
MIFSSLIASVAVLGSGVNSFAIRQNSPAWTTLPPTPELPAPISTTTTLINGVQLWMQKYNEKANAIPIVMDHGGLGYSAYFGSVISRLVADGYYVIAVDRRGHGRSTFNAGDVFTFDQMAVDIHDQLAHAGVPQYDVVGWSDGAMTTLAALINPVTAAPIRKAFRLRGRPQPRGHQRHVQRHGHLCRVCGALPHRVGTMEATLPQFTDKQLGTIDGRRVIIVGAEHEEAINLDTPAQLHKAIKGSKLQILKGVSHFAPMQDPVQFTKAVEDFLCKA